MHDSASRETEVARWDTVWDDENDRVEDRCWLMVAGLKIICQSLDLVKGHVLELMEPHPINAEIVQSAHRQYRIGQEAPVVEVNLLLRSLSYVEETIARKNEMKDTFAAQLKMVQIHKLVAQNKEYEEEEI